MKLLMTKRRKELREAEKCSEAIEKVERKVLGSQPHMYKL
jgi:hypothetical protein